MSVTDDTVVTGHTLDPLPKSSPPLEIVPLTPANQKQVHGNPQIALCAGGNLIATPL